MAGDTTVVRFGKNGFKKLFFFAVFLVCFGAVSAFPFVFHTTTMWYKLGVDRVLLLSGQLAGCYAAFFLLLQFVLISRFKPLVSAFGIGSLAKTHRLNGKVVTFLAVAHVLLILLPEGLENLPIGVKYWPEMVGVLLLLVIFIVMLVFYLKKTITYPVFKWVHRVLAILAFGLVLIHVLNVSDAFAGISVRVTVGIYALVCAAIFVLGKLDGRKVS